MTARRHQTVRVLIVGATGHVGGKVAGLAVRRGHRVRALVRPGTAANHLSRRGIEVVCGDLLDRRSLEEAMRGCDATMSTAIGYANRRPDDLKSLTDTQGIRNLADAALEAGVGRLVYCSVLTCDRARDVPHFWNKKLAEDYFEESGVPFVAIRPGAFLDQGDRDFWARGLRRGKLTFPGDPSVPLTFVHTDDVSRCLVDSLDIAPTHGALRVDIGCDRPVSIVDLAGIMTMVLGRPIAPHALPWFLVGAALRVGGLFDPWKRDLGAMLDYIRRGEYIADTTLQSSVFGPPPTIESATRRYLRDVGMLTDVNSNASDDSREVHA